MKSNNTEKQNLAKLDSKNSQAGIDFKDWELEKGDLSGWTVEEDKYLVKEWVFSDFKTCFAFINKIATIAEAQNHHPNIYNVYNRLTLKITSHDIKGLSKRDFALAQAINKII